MDFTDSKFSSLRIVHSILIFASSAYGVLGISDSSSAMYQSAEFHSDTNISNVVTCGLSDGEMSSFGENGTGVEFQAGIDPCWPCGDDGSQIDVLFLYTDLALADVGSINAIDDKVNQSIDYTNLSLANSNIDLVMNAVGLERVDYTADATLSDTCEHLSRLAKTGDGFMDEAHTLRDAYNADLVCLFIGGLSTGGCGFGNPPNPDNGFSVLAVIFTPTGPTAAHEFGHNFGCSHGRSQVGIDDPFRYNFAYEFDLPNGSPAVTAVWSGSNGVPVYSSPDVLYEGVPTGGALESPDAANNALMIEINRRSIANYRVSGDIYDCDDNGIEDSAQIAVDASLDLNTNGLLDVCELRLHVNEDATVAGDGFSWDQARHNLPSTLRNAGLPCSIITEVWVAGGVYEPDVSTADPTQTHLITKSCGLSVYGGFMGNEDSLEERILGSHPSVLSGILDGGVNSYHVLSVFNSNNILIDGFEILGGNASGPVGDRGGGGLRIGNSEVVLRNLHVHDNSALRFGGGGVLFDSTKITFESCIFEYNSSTGASGGFGGALDVRNVEFALLDCVIRENSADVGAGITIRNNPYQSSIIDSLIIDNICTGSGGGVWMDSSTAINIADSTLSGNTANGGGALVVFNGGEAVIDNAVMNDNVVSTFGGAIVVWNTVQLTVISSEIKRNSAVAGSGAINITNNSTAFISMSSFCGNEPGDFNGLWVDNGGNEFSAECLCLGDTDSNSVVNVVDLIVLLSAWGPNPGHAADFNADGEVNVIDLLGLLASWGVCP